MNRKRPIGLVIISVASISYGVLEIGQLFMPIVTENRIEYWVPSLGILLLIFGIGILALREWARKLMILTCFYGVFRSALGIINEPRPVVILVESISICLFGLVVLYLARPRTKMKFGIIETEEDLDDIKACLKRGKRHAELGRFHDAIRLYKRAIQIQPDHTEAYHLLVKAHIALNDLDAASEEYRILKELDSDLAEKL